MLGPIQTEVVLRRLDDLETQGVLDCDQVLKDVTPGEPLRGAQVDHEVSPRLVLIAFAIPQL